MKKGFSLLVCICLFAGLLTAAPLPEGFAETIGAASVEPFKADSNIYLVHVSAENLSGAMKTAAALDGVESVQLRNAEYLNPVGSDLPYYDAGAVLVKYDADADVRDALTATGCTDAGDAGSGWRKWTVNDPVGASIFEIQRILKTYAVIQGVQLCESAAYTVDENAVYFRTSSTLREDCYQNLYENYKILKRYEDGTTLYSAEINLSRTDLYSTLKAIWTGDSGLVWADCVYLEPVENGMQRVDWFKEFGYCPEQGSGVFCGWFTDAACTRPYMEKTGWAYPKFSNNNLHRVGFQLRADTTADSETTDLRIITTVDNLSYQYVRIKLFDFWGDVTFADVNVTIAYRKLSGLQTYEPTLFSTDSKYFVVLTVKNIPKSAFNERLYVDVSYMTGDGTSVSNYFSFNPEVHAITISKLIK